ncbi:MAG: ssDNA-binding protein [Armatimonadota bacterium]
MNKNINVKVKLNDVRLSFCENLFVPQVDTDDDGKPKPGGKAKYSCSFLMDDKKNAKDIAALNAAVAQVKQSEILKGKKITRNPVRDGAEKEYDGYGEGVKFITARNTTRPGVVNRDLSPIVAEDNIIYAGCYANATVEVYPYVHPKSGPGISFSLRNVQYLRKGEPFGKAPANPEEDFTVVEEEESAV